MLLTIAIFDFISETKNVIFRADQDILCVNFTIVSDKLGERPERFQVSFNVLSSSDIAVPGGVVLSTVTIVDSKLILF